jgi:hypothetical protein
MFSLILALTRPPLESGGRRVQPVRIGHYGHADIVMMSHGG